MDYSNKPLPPTPQDRQFPKSCPRPSHQLRHKISDISNPGLIDDVGSSGSEASFDDQSHPPSTEISAEIWDSYWSKTKDFLNPPCLPQRPPLCNQFSNLSYEKRNFATSDLPSLKSPTSQTKDHQDAAMLTRHVSQPKTTRPNAYSPFPPTPPPHGPHHSWPRRVDSRKSRPRAQTTPSRPSSNLSKCTTLEPYSATTSGEGTPLYMASPPPTPLFAPPFIDFPPLDIAQTPFMEEVSQFEEDDDSEEEEDSASTKLKKMLHIRTSSSNQGDSTPEKDASERLRRKSLRRLRKSLSDAASDANETFKGVFRGRKQSAV